MKDAIMRKHTTILTSTHHLDLAADAFCRELGLGREKKSRVLNILAGALAGSKRNWGYLVGQEGLFVSPTPKGEPDLAPPQQTLDASDRALALALAEDLSNGVKADIWYDAYQYRDMPALTVVERTQDAMETAAALLRRLVDGVPSTSSSDVTAPAGEDVPHPHSWSQSHSHWDEHPDFPLSDWLHEVENNETRLGYGAYVDRKIEQALTEDEDAETEDLTLEDFAIWPRRHFVAIADKVMMARADDLALQHGGYSWIGFLEPTPLEGIMVVGDSEAAVRRALIDALDPSSGA